MKKQVLLLSVALAVLAASPALADDWTDITTALNVPINTGEADNGLPGDIHIESTGSVSVQLAGAAVTINSDNSFLADAGSSISNVGTADAIGILVDLTEHGIDSTCTDDGCVSGLTEAGTIDLTGVGDTKRGLWLQGPADDTTGGPFSFIGDIDMSDSTMTITGDSSVGVLIDSLADLQGNLTLGNIGMKPTSDASTAGLIGLEVNGIVYGDIHEAGAMNITGTNNTSAGALIGMDLTGTINGDVVIDEGGSLNIAGAGARGILLTGNIDTCDTGVTPTCTGTGALVNHGTIASRGGGTGSNATGNPIASSAIGIGGSIAGGIFNVGPTFQGEEIGAAAISTQGAAPALAISTSLEVRDIGEDPFTIDIGKYLGDTVDPGFSVYNRGSISVASSNVNDDTQAVFISGSSQDAEATLDGGIFNSGLVQAVATSQAGGIPVSAIAFNIADYAVVGPDDTYSNVGNVFTYDNPNGGKLNTDALHDDQAAFVNSAETGSGIINATIAGTEGGEADGILISANAIFPSLINSGSISAVATTTDTTIGSLTARAIVDRSGTLTYIQNNGLISAVATTLDNDAQVVWAIDLDGDTSEKPAFNGVMILNQATANSSARIIGGIRFGSGNYQTVDVEGASTDNIATITGDIAFGGGSIAGSDLLTIGDFATVTGKITADPTLGATVRINNGGTLNLLNDSEAFNAYDFVVNAGGTLNLTVKQEFQTGIIDAANSVFFDIGAKFNITYGSFVPSSSDFILISAPRGDLTVMDQSIYQQQINDDLPFLFQSATLILDTTTDPVDDRLLLRIDPKDAAELGLTGYAAQMLPFANQALANDDVLGAAFVNGIDDQKTAQLAYNEMAPDVTGGARAIAIALTDQSSGPVAARQRILRMYGKETGEVTLWGEEFAEFVTDPGDRSTGQTGFKDHGFGFVMGMDGGDPKTGWYGGAFSFYTGDIVEPLPRNSHTNTLWYMLTGYTDWRGKGLFLDTKADVGYMTLKSKRFINLTLPDPNGSGGTVPFVDEADGKRPGLVGALGFTTGAILAYGSTTITPQISVDGMTMRQEGYTETHIGTSSTGNGKGMDLQTQSFYASSARIFLGTEIRQDLNFGDFFLQPDLRVGYRYDFINDATKLKVNFADIGTASTPTAGPTFTVIGPDPAQGNFVAGASIAATTDAWTLGANFDFVRGTNGATTEIGTIHLLGRI